jgi:hypothetical protein
MVAEPGNYCAPTGNSFRLIGKSREFRHMPTWSSAPSDVRTEIWRHCGGCKNGQQRAPARRCGGDRPGRYQPPHDRSMRASRNGGSSGLATATTGYAPRLWKNPNAAPDNEISSMETGCFTNFRCRTRHITYLNIASARHSVEFLHRLARGCVKTPKELISTQQRNRGRCLSEFLMRASSIA